MAISEGDRAPSFSLKADDGTVITLDSLSGKKSSPLFHQGQHLRLNQGGRAMFATPFPGSGNRRGGDWSQPDSLESHRKFKQKYELPYKLLSDEGHQLADAFDIWKEKSMYGLKFMGVERTTVIIDRGGRIARIFPRVKIPGHVQEVEKAVRELA